MNITFEESLENYMSVYYYFLDGYINPDVGYPIENTYGFILSHFNEFLIKNKINLLKYLISDNIISLIFQGFIDIKVDFDIDNLQSNEKIWDITKIFNYCICQIGNDTHATSLLFFIKNRDLYVASFNSGEGLDLHKKINDHYSPYDGRKICDDFINNQVKGLKIILSLLIIANLYNKIQNIINDTDNITILSNSYEEITIYNFNTIIKLIKNLKTLIEKNKILDDIFLRLKINGYSLDVLEKSMESFNVNGINIHGIKITNINDIKIIYPENYYNIIINFISDYEKLQLTPDINLNDIERSLINSNIINKIILHNHNDFLYIYQQESGSCSWFSIYWPIVFYYIFNLNIHEYYNTIYYIYDVMNTLVKRIFNENTLKLCFENDNQNAYRMNFLCEKFININILDPNLLIKQYIYETKINITFNKNFQENKVDFSKINDIKRLVLEIEKHGLIDILYNLYNNEIFEPYVSMTKNKIKVEVDSFNNTIILINELFDYQKVKRMYIFSETKPASKIFDNLLTGIEDKDDHEDLKDMIRNNFNYKIDNIPYNIQNYLKQFIDTYNDDPEPMYIKNYIHWASIMIDQKYKTYILEYINFIHRFSLFILILRSVNYIIHLYPIRYTNRHGGRYYHNAQKKELINKIYTKAIFPLLMDKKSSKINDCNDINKCYIINIYYDLKYINHLININNVLINKSFSVLDVKIDDTNNLKQCESFLENYSRTYDEYIKLKEFLFINPKYIHQDFNENELIINTNQFVKLNLKEILDDNEIKIRFIKHYSSKYYEKSIETDKEELFWIISNLQLLICGGIGYLENDEIPDVFTYYAFVYNYSSVSYIEFKNKIENIKHGKTKEQFIDYLIYNNSEIVFNITNLIKLHINKEITFNLDTNLITINHENYFQINFTNDNIIKKYFNIIPGTVFLLNENYNDIYIFNKDTYFQLFYNIEIISDEEFNCEINNIKIKNNNDIKYNDIIYPFKYIIPKNIFNIIYKKSDIYYIVYFVNENQPSEFHMKNNLLGKQYISPGIYTISINKDNMMFPNIDNYFFKELSLDSGLNLFNIIYQNPNNKTKFSAFNFCRNIKILR